jgi:hypothetical protein
LQTISESPSVVLELDDGSQEPLSMRGLGKVTHDLMNWRERETHRDSEFCQASAELVELWEY